MALQVWLPLTKDLRNQGLANSNNFGTTTTFATTGKLGSKSLYSNAQKTITFTELTNVTNFSFAYWIKVDSTATISSWADILGLECIAGSSTTIIRDEFTSTAGCHQILMGKDSTIGSDTYTYYGTGASSTGAKDVWTHYAVIKNDTNTYVYTNGALTNTLTNTNFENSPQKLTGKIYLGNTSSTAAQLQDVRIYDHCLSPMEVKELAKGLVLHYPLNRQGWGQENLLPISGSTIINSTQSFEFQGWVQNFYTKTWMNEHLTPGKQYTLSYTVTCLSIPDSTYTFKENRASPILVHQGSGWNQITTTSDGIKDTNMSVGQSRDYKCTFTFATASETYEYYGLCGYTALYRNSSNNTQYAKFRIDNLKLEEGSIATPWCPNSSDTLATTMGLNGTTEYDCSGFCNNGTRTGTFTWTSDTPKYNVSQYFSGSSYILTDSSTFSWFDFEQCTLAVWLKPTITPSGYTGTIGISHNQNAGHKSFCIGNYGGKFTVCSADGNYVNTQSITLSINEWHHCVATLDGTTVKMYVDGELVKTYILDWGNTALANDTRFQVGVDLPGTDEIYTGYYSDVRAYTTALSADDVKSLYQNCATIDPDGTIRGQIRN